MKNVKEKGITLIALVVTIIILLILAGVTIGFAINGTGLFDKSKYATETYNNKAKEEEIALGNLENEINTYTRAGTGFSETLLYPTKQEDYIVANAYGTEYHLNDSYKSYKYLLVEVTAPAHYNGNWSGNESTWIRTANIVQSDVFSPNNVDAEQRSRITYSVHFANGSYVGFWFKSNDTFCIGYSSGGSGTVGIINIYGINF